MASISMDVAYDSNEDFPSIMFHIEKNYSVKASVVRWVGSGGGWPEIKFEGDEENLKRLYLDKFNPGFGLEDFELDQ